MSTNATFSRLVILAVTTAVFAAVVFLAGFWAGSARGGSENRAETQPAPMPDWFLPIWDYYDRNPAVTPAFDIAALYSGKWTHSSGRSKYAKPGRPHAGLTPRIDRASGTP